MSKSLRGERTGAVGFAFGAVLIGASLAGCGGNKAAGQDPASSAERTQVQLLALEAALQENRRVMGHVLQQNARLRDDLQTSQAARQTHERRLEALEQRLAQAPITEAQPAQTPEPAIRPAATVPPNAAAGAVPAAGPSPGVLQRLNVRVPSAQAWQVLYTNREMSSQKVRIRRRSDGPPAQIRLALSGAVESDSGPPHPKWDLNGPGAEKWLRIGCGQEISARAEDTEFEVLVRQDPKPEVCEGTLPGARP